MGGEKHFRGSRAPQGVVYRCFSGLMCSFTSLTVLLLSPGAFANTGTVNVGKLRSEADSALASGEIDRSLKLLTEVIHHEPENERNFYKRCRVNLRKRKYKEALADLNSALSLKPT